MEKIVQDHALNNVGLMVSNLEKKMHHILDSILYYTSKLIPDEFF